MAIGEKGGIEEVVRAMGAHELSAGVQQAGCSTLTNLAAKKLENRVVFAAKGGIEAVERAMRAHQSASCTSDASCTSIVEVQEAGCGALRDFAFWGSGLGSHVREADVVAPVKKDVSAFPYNWVLQTRGCFWTKLGTQSLFWFF